MVAGKKVGVTPMVLEDQGSAEASGGTYVKIKMSGYQDLGIWYPRGAWNYSVNINLNPLSLNNLSNAWSQGAISSQVVEKVSDQLLEIQTKLAAGEKIDVKILDEIIAANPHLASGYFLRGIYHLAENRENDAKIDLSKAAALDKDNKEVQYLVNRYAQGAK
jgi:hypothetical protein